MRAATPIEPGTVFGTRVIVRELPSRVRRSEPSKRLRVLLCSCTKCGRESESLMHNLKGGAACPFCAMDVRKSKMPSNRSHGLSNTPTYRIWKAMRERCSSPRNIGFASYGGRGIRVCERWNTSFEAFLEDMGERPNANHSIDRIDTNGHYEPSNCRWSSNVEQARNKRNNVILRAHEVAKTMAEWTEDAPVTAGAISYRLRNGWSAEDAVTLPAGAHGDGRIKPGDQLAKRRRKAPK